MSRHILCITLTASALALGGCSSFKLGAFCYVPAGGGQCAATAAPNPERASQ